MDPKLANSAALTFNALKMTQKSKAILPTYQGTVLLEFSILNLGPDQDQIPNYVANA
jgi:hypothetical protein